MGKTMAEKIISEAFGQNVTKGEIVVVDVDLAFVNDASGPLAVEKMKAAGNGQLKVFDKEKVVVFIDHAAPSCHRELSNTHKVLRNMANATGAKMHDIDQGVCHQVAIEKYTKPGDIVAGADSHTCTGGALGAFSTGMGATDVGIAIMLGQTWLRVPDSIKVNVTGQLQKGVYAKDLILHIIGIIGADGANYKAIEFVGETIDSLDMDSRFTLSNMVVEAGAKVGLVPSDKITKDYLKKQGREFDWKEVKPDPEADYETVINVDASLIEPTISMPHTVDNVKPLKDCNGVKVNQVFVGSCTNGRLSDLKIVSSILKGKQINKSIRLIVSPASKEVMEEAINQGYITEIIKSGGTIFSPSCGPCFGAHGGILGDEEVCLSTQNRNFKGRMGNPEAFIYLGSPATAAATALAGEITDPREVL